MQQQAREIPVYADIGEVRTVTGTGSCSQLLADGWVLLGVYPLTTVGEMVQKSLKELKALQPSRS